MCIRDSQWVVLFRGQLLRPQSCCLPRCKTKFCRITSFPCFLCTAKGIQHTARVNACLLYTSHELGIFQPGDHAEHPLLLSPLEVGLEAHDVIPVSYTHLLFA